MNRVLYQLSYAAMLKFGIAEISFISIPQERRFVKLFFKVFSDIFWEH